MVDKTTLKAIISLPILNTSVIIDKVFLLIKESLLTSLNEVENVVTLENVFSELNFVIFIVL